MDSKLPYVAIVGFSYYFDVSPRISYIMGMGT